MDATRIERSGGGSIQNLFNAVLGSVEAAEKGLANPVSVQQPTNTSTSPYGAAVAGSLNSLNGSTLAAERLAAARENLDSLAALVASSLFQVQYIVASDALIAYVAFHGLRSDSSQERRLVHKALGIVKTAQYLIYLTHEATTNGVLSYFNIVGLGVTVAAAYTWGFASASSAASKKVVKEETKTEKKKEDSPY
ncbi:UNVERIFIED_CONTAM: hypothetical protein HDU68_010118 [Siphonaria sp. JEL0065]|nr:hypothetical protein HDU68_010118 [Siphonaria sp. JEL0065]